MAKCQRDDLFDINRVDNVGLTNLQRMEQGKPPIGYDGEPVNLHHTIGAEPGPIAEINETLHSDKSGILHIPQYEKVGGEWVPRKNYSFRAQDGRKSDWDLTKGGNPKTTQASKDFAKWSKEYWKKRAEEAKNEH